MEIWLNFFISPTLALWEQTSSWFSTLIVSYHIQKNWIIAIRGHLKHYPICQYHYYFYGFIWTSMPQVWNEWQLSLTSHLAIKFYKSIYHISTLNRRKMFKSFIIMFYWWDIIIKRKLFNWIPYFDYVWFVSII